MWNYRLFINSNYLVFSILLFVNVYNSQSSFITIPFKIYREHEPPIYSSIEEYFTYQTELKYYGQISMGEKEVPIPIFFTFNDYGFYFITKGTDLGNVDTSYDPSSSPSCQYDKKSILYFRNYGNSTKANDTFIFNTQSNNTLKCQSLKFLYAYLDNKKKNSFLLIGLRLIGDIIRDEELNLIMQLKHKKYINTYDWSIHFDEKNPENEGVLLIGAKPHNYNPKKYNENYYLNSVLSKYSYGIWNIELDKIYFLNDDKEIEVNDYTKFTLVHDSGLISGTLAYEKLIKKYFFDKLFSSNKCNFETSRLYSRVYFCRNTDEIKKELKKNFPTLKMLSKPYMKTFELTYDDLFREKIDKIYFLIYFSDYQASSWEVGLPFLKKYILNYNYDSKVISFYNNDLENMKDNNKNNESGIFKMILVIIILIFVFLILCFCIGKKYSSMKRAKRLNAKELESEFSKQISESEYSPPINEKENSKYRLI